MEFMGKYTHDFVNNYQGIVAFGLDRETDVNSIVIFLQRLSPFSFNPEIFFRE
jgi:hypothetical protein